MQRASSRRHWTAGNLLDEPQERAVVAAIARAEKGNRGEVRVHLENRTGGLAPLDRAARVFTQLDMDKTRDGTGVLLYVAVRDRCAAVFAGEGIHKARGWKFWQSVVARVTAGFAEKRPADGLVAAVDAIGDLLRQEVPGVDSAGNELPDTITTE